MRETLVEDVLATQLEIESLALCVAGVPIPTDECPDVSEQLIGHLKA
jgi:hypothetical protein